MILVSLLNKPYVWIPLCVVIIILLLIFITAFICYKIVFYASRKPKYDDNALEIYEGKAYEPYYEQMRKDIKAVIDLPKEYVSIKSKDGLTLRGKYFELKKGAPIELMIHGYRGNGKRDLSTGVLRARSKGRNVLVIDHRASGLSDGNVITFGVKECEDILGWINYIINNIDKDAKIFLTGISMGAATVMNCSAMELPENVVAILADCGYTSPKEIICKVMKDLKLPSKLLYPFIKLGARMFGHFNIDGVSSIESVKNCKLPIIFIHGKDDAFVPYEMSVKCYEACGSSNKKLVIIDNADHGLAFMANSELYLNELEGFFGPLIV
jgi:fermentation-respiration switch protein FrsA (DUF1100 family)